MYLVAKVPTESADARRPFFMSIGSVELCWALVALEYFFGTRTRKECEHC